MNKPVPKLGAIDLNLLVVFDAIMRDRSVTRAGQRLSLSQPAMSHALNRLRWMLKDQLFIRTPEGMMPTPRAEQLAQPVRRAYAIEIKDLPCPSPAVRSVMLWHRRFDGQPGHRWLREMVAKIAKKKARPA